MNNTEAWQILAILKAAYPASYNGMTKKEATGTVHIWEMQFADMPADIVMMAVQKLIATNKFPPSVAEVKDKIKTIHWEAQELAYGWASKNLSEDMRKQYQRICELTDGYKYGKSCEPQLYQLSKANFGGMSMKFSCKGCDNRHPGCHSTCPDYAIDKAFHEAERSEQSKEKEISGGLTWQTMNSIAKINSKKRKGSNRFHEQ